MSSTQGCYLVAPPYLPDENFFRSVVLMIEHDEQGAVGVILNRPTNEPLVELLKVVDNGLDPENDWSLEADVLHFGGPVEGPLAALHSMAEFSERQVMQGVHFSTLKENLQGVFSTPGTPFRCFRGYAGWAPGQLEEEIDSGGWFILPGHSCHVFDDPADIWERLSSSYAADLLATMVHADIIPADPRLN